MPQSAATVPYGHPLVFLIRASANSLRKLAQDGLSGWAPDTYMDDLDKAPASQF